MDTRLAQQIGSAARDARQALKITQAEAAERVGVSPEFYARIERGQTLPSTPTLAAMAKALQVSADRLLGLGTETQARTAAPMATAESDPAPVRLLCRRVRRAKPRTVRLLSLIAAALEK